MPLVFRVTRNGCYDKPCDNAEERDCWRIDQRTVDDPDKLKPYENAKSWNGRGSNHRIVNRRITRDMPCRAWFIEFDSAEELLNLIRAYDGALVAPSRDWPSDWSIELNHQCE